ncbi:MAG: riboflavin synthase [Flavobacteriales bacterium]|nr:riboflavin synthase [Flavobacteriales bacterium]HRH69389.1 riboflavin synthase [Flavobacteriales bacterium]
MFTGIIEEVGEIVSVERNGTNCELAVRALMSPELRVDQSVAHNGVCLTVIGLLTDPVLFNTIGYRVTAVQETLERSTLGTLRSGDGVNLERSLRLGDRLDGHMVQGHVDTRTVCTAVDPVDGSWAFRFALPEKKQLLVEKGSICINGVSLTIASLSDREFTVVIIPYTFEHTTFRHLVVGQYVNIEYDVVGKYVDRMLAGRVTT